MNLDSEQKRVLKATLPGFGGFLLGYPFFMWIFGKLDSWSDLLTFLLAGLILGLLLAGFYVMGAKSPKKDD